MKRVVFYSLVFVAGFIAVSLLSFYLLTHPREVAFDRAPADFGLSPKDVTLATSDQISIFGWHLASEQSPDKVLLLLHGYPANKHDLLSVAQDLYPEFSLLLIDLRSFGESDGTTTFGVHEQKDVAAAVDFLAESGYEHIGIFGYSLGGAIALESAAQDERIDAVASYGAFSNLRTLAHDTYKYLLIFKYPLTELLNLWAKISFGQWAHTVSPEKVLKNIDVPIFLGHAQNDDTVPFHHAERLQQSAETHNKQVETFFPNIDYHQVIPLGLTTRLSTFFQSAFTE